MERNLMDAIIDVIKKRYSVRNYSSRPIEKDKAEQLEAYLKNNAQGPLGSRVRFELIDAMDYEPAELKKFGTYGFITGSRVYIAGVVKSNITAMEDFGYCMEKNVLFATGLGLGTCWLGGSLNRSTFSQKMNISEDEVLPAVTPVGYAEERKTLRDRYIRIAVGAKSRKKPAELFFDHSNNALLDMNSPSE
jgi:nitroreductase